jgi:hypothetical protein
LIPVLLLVQVVPVVYLPARKIAPQTIGEGRVSSHAGAGIRDVPARAMTPSLSLNDNPADEQQQASLSFQASMNALLTIIICRILLQYQ